MERIGYYGIHVAREDGLAYLDQEKYDRETGRITSTGSAAYGRDASRSPFVVVPVKRTLRCSHNIQLNFQTIDPEVRERMRRLAVGDRLVRAMLPVPKAPGVAGCWLERPDDVPDLNARLALLARMTSPVRSIRFDADVADPRRLSDELTLTNVQPLVLTGVTARRVDLLRRLAEQAVDEPRLLVAVGARDVPVPAGLERVTTGIGDMDLEELMLLPWEGFGATVVREFVRRTIDWLPDRPDVLEANRAFFERHPELVAGRRRPPR